MVLLILALIWAAALLPPLLRSRLEGNPVDSIGRFRRHLRVLESTTPAASALAADPESFGSERPMPAAWASEARRLRLLRRRRQVAAMFVAAMTTTLIVGLLPEFRMVLALHVAIDLAAVGYVTLLIQARSREAERQMAARFESPMPVERAEGFDLADLSTQAY